MSKRKYYRLNYEISPWLPKGSIWYKTDEGDWERHEGSHSVGDDYWFAQLLEQESEDPSGPREKRYIPIISEVEKKVTWTEVDGTSV